MTAPVAAALVVAAAALAFAGAVFQRTVRIRRRHRAMLGAPLPFLREDAERLVQAERALYHGTRFADGARLLDERWGPPCVADLFCTAEAIFLRREAEEGLLALPLAWILDASLLRAWAELAGKELPVLRLRWRRGGEILQTELSLRGGLPQLEKLRREVHLRQGEGSALAELQRFLVPPAPKP